MTDAHRKSRLHDRFNRLHERALQHEEDGNHEKAVALYQEMAALLEQAAALLGTGERERLLKERVVSKIRELGGDVPDEITLSDDLGVGEAAADADADSDFEAADSVGDADSDVAGVVEPDHDFSAVGGRERVKRLLQREVIKPFRDPDRYDRYGLTVVNGVLFYGRPGTGKTFLANALAGELDATVIKTGGSRLKNRFLGGSEENVKELFALAEQFQPCMIFIDEIDQILEDRSEASTSGKSDMVNEFLDRMMAVKDEQTVVVGATNHPQDLDRAALQPARFSEQVKIDLPSEKTRYAILQKLVERKPDPEMVRDNEIDLRTIAERTHSYSASDLERLYEVAARQAAEAGEPLIQRNFRNAVEETEPSMARS
jgi:SpoVK/Ycf46/Vps4 family AAA+-type ATPase